MSSENLGLVVVGLTLFAINAFLGAPIASRIAKFFGRVLPAETPRPAGGSQARAALVSGVSDVSGARRIPSGRTERPEDRAA